MSASSGQRRPPLPPYVSIFDSGSMPLEVLAAHLNGRDFDWFEDSGLQSLAVRIADKLPGNAREKLYRWAGGMDATPVRDLHRVDGEAIARWAAGAYPERTYPAVMIGSSNGAAIHLCAALGIP